MKIAHTKLLIRGFALLSIFHTILQLPSGREDLKVFLSALVVLLTANDCLRPIYMKRRPAIYNGSFLLSNVMAGFLLYNVYCAGTQAIMVLLLVEVLITDHQISAVLVTVNAAAFGGALYAAGAGVSDIVLPYFIMFAVIYLYRKNLQEKSKVELLNRELKTANATLKEYSDRIEELAVTKERTRIAQELHDSLGHYLAALKMNLEFAGKTAGHQPERVKQIIHKAHDLTKESILKLRQAVTLLQGSLSGREFEQALRDIFSHFQEAGSIRFELEMDAAIEAAQPDVKHCLYQSVQETITNAMKHGHASYVSVRIQKDRSMIAAHIYNNGSACGTIVKSNGLKGIEKRAAALGGEAVFSSGNETGFDVKIRIPCKEE
ncbi:MULTISPECIES: sensor histidine kinase [Bacillus amyloliquefaciens group]|uniref:sensor histidine kinase n=1 Tax=Bacillus amyloliquefaciens group TaxID=1938374 RepID=UPI0002059913|nr:sensor histidine kinase [Bacillus amyloliquefaciens]AIW32307.1 histidine kinase [Bacillus subtilis]AEB22388.1 Sensor histidine kinase [Bacillus amyloliquefaciens TA208]AEK87350.1 sensory transduction protein kinase [Bacillus amyloliquefaciens XH7]MEC1833640.1 sensor histidine kinase [Bacillus amyloliquefaciens]MEC1835204.1 sensor histidine kinase [Bacillus amyloliquefaciens]